MAQDNLSIPAPRQYDLDVEWDNDGGLHIVGLFELPFKSFTVVIDDDDFDGEGKDGKQPDGWDNRREIDYGGLDTEG